MPVLDEEKNSEIIQWLMEDDQPSLKLRVLTEILEAGENAPEVVMAKSAILQSPAVNVILEKMHPDGYWLQKKPDKRTYVGDGVEYGSFASTHFCLAYLSELGLDRHHAGTARASERYLSLQQSDGDWLGHNSCLFGYNLRTFIRLGYRDDRRVQQTVDLTLETIRQDGGYLCEIHEGKPGRKPAKSCIRGSVKCLLAFAELPEYWDHPRCLQLVNYFIDRGGIYQSRHPGVLVNKDMQRFSFPITWRTNSWEVLYALSKMGYGSHPSLSPAWAELESRADASGRYHLDWTSADCPWQVGKRGEANKWVTFYVLLARKYKNSRLR